MTGDLGPAHLRLAVADCLRETNPERRNLDAILKRLWREPKKAVINAYDALLFGSLEVQGDGGGRCVGLLATRMRALRRPLPRRDKPGMGVEDVARALDMDRETLVRLMERHDLLELVPFGGHQRRRLVSDRAFREGLGHNVDPGSARSPRLDGHARSMVFPVFYADALDMLRERLGWNDIQSAAASIKDKRLRMRWLLTSQADLPDKTLAGLGGYSLRGVKKARAGKSYAI